MRKLTFKSYLQAQLMELSGIKTTSLYRYSALAVDNARLCNALSLYLVLYANDSIKNRLLKKYDCLNKESKRLAQLNDKNLANSFSDDLSEYKTIYENYLYRIDKKNREEKVKLLMHKRILDVKQSKNISAYHIYTSLKLNAGNVNCFIKNADTSKVSLNTARNILEYVNNYQ